MASLITTQAKRMKGWHKGLGNKVTDDQLAAVHKLGGRPGSKVTMALAMYLRPEGATQGQVAQVCGGPQLNKMRDLIESKLVKRINVDATNAGHTVYKIELTGKGAAGVPGYDANGKVSGTEAPVKKAKAAKGKRKPRPAKVTPTPAGDAAPQPQGGQGDAANG